jgi:archaeal type IV pilus assembly protein PilA
MKKFPNLRNKRAISPVIATVILVAVAITISVAVAYWMGGIAGQYTKFEKVEIQSAYSTKGTGGWVVTMALKDTGSAPSTLISAFVNDLPVNATGYGASTWGSGATAGMITTNVASSGTVITSGQSVTVSIWIPTGFSTLSSGTTLNVKIHSAGGMDYIQLVQLV